MERLNDVYASKESKFLLGHIVRDGGKRLSGYILFMLLYTGLLRIVTLSFFEVAYDMSCFGILASTCMRRNDGD